MTQRLHPATFSFTEKQLRWIRERQQKTGLPQVEILRRALDEYVEREETKEQRTLFTPQQRQDIRDAAKIKGISELQIVRTALTRELNGILQRF